MQEGRLYDPSSRDFMRNSVSWAPCFMRSSVPQVSLYPPLISGSYQASPEGKPGWASPLFCSRVHNKKRILSICRAELARWPWAWSRSKETRVRTPASTIFQPVLEYERILILSKFKLNKFKFKQNVILKKNHVQKISNYRNIQIWKFAQN
jgi:hypothetical protein